MARQPDIQYVQMYQHGSAARKLELLTPVRKQYELPSQQPRRKKAKKPAYSPLDVCSVAVAVFMLFTMVIGLLQVGVASSRQQELQTYIDTLTQERADLQRAFENAYDLEQVAQRAGQMGLVEGTQVRHIPLEAEDIPQSQDQELTFGDILSELFAKAPR